MRADGYIASCYSLYGVGGMILLLPLNALSCHSSSAGKNLVKKFDPLRYLSAHCRNLYAISAVRSGFAAGARTMIV